MIFAVDGGGSNLRVARVEGGRITARKTVGISPKDYSRTRDDLDATINELRGGERCDALGFSLAGNTDGETILGAGNLGAFKGYPIAEHLRKTHNCPVWLFGDARAMGASEYSVQNRPLFLYIWGSGVGSVFVLGDDIFRAGGVSPSINGEGGHQRIIKDGRQCGCGQDGCLEAYVGGTSIKRYYGKPAEDLSDDEWEIVLDHMAHGVHNVVTLTRGLLPIYFGGGIGCGQWRRISSLSDRLESTQLIVPTLPPISRVTHGEDAGLHGTALIVQHELAAL